MKKKLFRAVPHLTVILALIYIVLFTIDRFNENMKFISNDITKWGMAVFAVLAIATAVALIRRHLMDDMPEESPEDDEAEDMEDAVDLLFDDDLPEPPAPAEHQSSDAEEEPFPERDGESAGA